MALLVLSGRYVVDIEDITWPRGDTNFILSAESISHE